MIRPITIFNRTLGSIVLALTLFSGNLTAQAQDSSATPVGVDTVLQEPLNQTMPVIGRLVATQSGIVAARTAGAMGEFRVQVGDRVKEGDIIAILIKDSLESKRELWLAQVAQAKAKIETGKAQLQLREQDYKRQEGLKASAAFSQAKLDDKRQEVAVTKSTLAEARAALDVARANLMLAEIELYNADIRAPYDSIIAVRHMNIGNFVQAGDPVVTLIDDTTLEIEADIPTERIPGLPKGTSVSYNLTGSTDAVAFVRAIIPDENPLTRTRSVRFTTQFANVRNLAMNQSVTVMIPVGAPRQVISVHKDAILDRGGKKVVYVAQDGIATLRSVTLGVAVGGRFEVLGGLKKGEIVVIRGNERLLPDQAISFNVSGE